MRYTAFFVMLFISLGGRSFAENSLHQVPLFNEQELKQLEYLKSSQRLLDIQTVEMIEKSRLRMKAALKLYAMRDQQQRQSYFAQDVWAFEDKREDYFTLMNWLERISPLSKEKNKSKETK